MVLWISRLYLAFFLNTSAFTAPFALEIQLGAADAANFMKFDGFDIGGEQGKGPFHAYAVGYLPNGEGSRMACTLALDHVAFESLDTLFVPFQDLIIDGDIITGFKLRKFDLSGQLFVYKCYSGVHDSNF